MIKKLRLKFILISMLSVFFVLAITLGAINVSNYVGIENDTQNVLREAIRQGTDDPMGGGPMGPGGADLRQEHYFVVSFDVNGAVQKTNNRQMFILSQSECNDLATKVFKGELKGGKYGTFRYSSERKNDGLTYVAFVDARERLDSFHRFLLVSSLTSVGAYLVLFILILVGSKIVFKPAEEAYRNQKRFITNASHELKTPLTVISADLDLIEMDHGKDEWSESIRGQVKRLTEMTNQLVTLSKLEEEDVRFAFADFSLNEVCEHAIKDFSANFQNAGIQFAHNVTGNLTMFGNRRLIEELISIFLDNSLKYTGGDQKSSYFVVSQNAKGRIEFRFSNTISPDDEVDARQVMERFYRSPSNKKEGSGVGLSIAQEIIHLHKGTIKVDKNNNTLTFIVTFR